MLHNDLSPDEKTRYRRHLMLPEVGLKGQLQLKNSKILLIGAGGLGCPSALYLAAAGIGHIGLMDFDLVDESNLQRQILYNSSCVGEPKVQEAKKRLQELNPHIQVQVYNTKINPKNILELIKKYDLVIDGTDNFTTRFLINDACYFLKKPLVYGSIYRFEGQVSVFNINDGPCYRCLFPGPPPDGLAPNCAEAGVLGILPGIVGTLQATEAIKLILKTGHSFNKRLLTFDALNGEFREFVLEKNPHCPLCGPQPTITKLREEPLACSLEDINIPEISYKEYKELLKKPNPPILIDVRTPLEYEENNIGGQLIPLDELEKRLEKLDKNTSYVVHCQKGSRSQQAVKILLKAGFLQTWSLKGGVEATYL